MLTLLLQFNVLLVKHVIDVGAAFACHIHCVEDQTRNIQHPCYRSLVSLFFFKLGMLKM